MSIFVSKQALFRLVHQKVKQLLTRNHVLTICEILFEEILKDINNDKTVMIYNFGKFYMEKKNIREFYSYKYKDWCKTREYNYTRFTLTRHWKSPVIQSIDYERTFNSCPEKEK